MAELSDLLKGNGPRDALSGVLFLSAGTLAMDVYSAVMSSPWAAESWGGDPAKAESARRYVRHGLAVTGLMVGASAAISHSSYPLIGGALVGAYMWWLYESALKRAGPGGGSRGMPHWRP
jgi:hypothetical protein